MAITLTSTVSGESSNTYATAAEALTYHDAHLDGAVWTSDAVEADQRARALIMAARILDAREWHGEPTESTQKLKWPRAYVPKNDSTRFDETIPGSPELWPDDEIPQFIKDAQCELALCLLNGWRPGAIDGDDLASFSADGSTFNYDTARRERLEGRLPASVTALIQPYLANNRLRRA